MSTTSKSKILRVAQWSAGRVGSVSLRAVIQHSGLELVGLKVHTEAKSGREAGELCGIEPTGIAATGDVDEIIALQPDCILYMQEGIDVGDICRILSAGINIVTTRGEFHHPRTMDQTIRAQVEQACQQGQSSIHSTGVSPGFVTEALPLVLTSVSRHLDCLTIDEFADMTASCSDEMLLEVIRFGRPADAATDTGLMNHMADGFGQSLNALADGLSLSLEGIESSAETALSKRRISLRGGRFIEPGTVAAQRFTVKGMRGGKPILQFRANWFCTTDLDKDWSIRENGWRIQVDSDAPLDVYIGMPVSNSADDFPQRMAGYTAFRAVNCVPYVCEAKPGIRTAAELPQIAPRLA